MYLILELRARGLEDEALFPYEDLIEGEQRVWDFIELFCGQFFEEREMSITLDGSGTNTLYLPLPIISLSSVTMGGATLIASSLYTYNRYYPDDRLSPKIKYSGTFTDDFQNIVVTGTWGFVEQDGSTPRALVEAAMKILVNIALKPLVGSAGYEGNTQNHRLIKEKTDTYFYELSANPATNGPTGIAEIDKVLLMYRRGNNLITGTSV